MEHPVLRSRLLLPVVAAFACGCGGDDGGARSLEARVDGGAGPVDTEVTECRFDGDRQATANGIVRNSGENAQYVSISVRFIDGDGVRVDIASDSVSDLEPGESARWDASVYSDDAGSIVECEVSAEVS